MHSVNLRRDLVEIKFFQLESLILAQNERWRQATPAAELVGRVDLVDAVPGMRTLRSRGSDMIAVASLSGFSRTSMIVSERAPLAPSPFFFGRLVGAEDQDRLRLPGSVVASVSLPSFSRGPAPAR